MAVTELAGESREEQEAERPGARLVELLLDSLPAWTVVAAAIAFLYLVWVTLELLGVYVGGMPRVTP